MCKRLLFFFLPSKIFVTVVIFCTVLLYITAQAQKEHVTWAKKSCIMSIINSVQVSKLMHCDADDSASMQQ